MSSQNKKLKTAAFEIGLNNLSDNHWDELQKAINAKEYHTHGMPGGLTIWDEPAHIFRASDEA